jgi:hypothetical protein
MPDGREVQQSAAERWRDKQLAQEPSTAPSIPVATFQNVTSATISALLKQVPVPEML